MTTNSRQSRGSFRRKPSLRPKYPPHFGEYYLNEILRALLANKDVWHKTALLITYDENGGFFDHVLPPVPPLDADMGLVSAGITIPAESASRDFNSERSVDNRKTVVGMGARVPMLIISPWSAGGRVCSETFDHTSVLRFLDTWLIAREKQPKDAPVFTNISSWRRAIAGDLTSAFDFDRTNVNPMDQLIDTVRPVRIFTPSERATAHNAPEFKPTIADVNADPGAKKPVASKQDQTRCEILPLAYDFQVLAALRPDKRLQFTFKNAGKLGVALSVLPNDRNEGAWFYRLEGARRARRQNRFWTISGRITNWLQERPKAIISSACTDPMVIWPNSAAIRRTVRNWLSPILSI